MQSVRRILSEFYGEAGENAKTGGAMRQAARRLFVLGLAAYLDPVLPGGR